MDQLRAERLKRQVRERKEAHDKAATKARATQLHAGGAIGARMAAAQAGGVGGRAGRDAIAGSAAADRERGSVGKAGTPVGGSPRIRRPHTLRLIAGCRVSRKVCRVA